MGNLDGFESFRSRVVFTLSGVFYFDSYHHSRVVS